MRSTGVTESRGVPRVQREGEVTEFFLKNFFFAIRRPGRSDECRRRKQQIESEINRPTYLCEYDELSMRASFVGTDSLSRKRSYKLR